MRCSVVGLLDPCRPCHWPILRICVPKRRRPRGRAFGNSGLAMPGRNPHSIRGATKDAARAGPPSLLRHLRPPPSSPWLQWNARRVSMVPSLIPAPPDGDQPQGTRTLSHIPPQSARGSAKRPVFMGFFGVCPRQIACKTRVSWGLSPARSYSHQSSIYSRAYIEGSDPFYQSAPKAYPPKSRGMGGGFAAILV